MGDGSLTAFWVSFPKDASFPLGLGVTAWSRADAFRLLEEQGYDFHLRAVEVAVREDVTIDDIDQTHVRPNMGPMILRGVSVSVCEHRIRCPSSPVNAAEPAVAADKRLGCPLEGELMPARARAAPAPPRGRATVASSVWRLPLNGETLGIRVSMATIREYFEQNFPQTVSVDMTLTASTGSREMGFAARTHMTLTRARSTPRFSFRRSGRTRRQQSSTHS